MAIQVRMDLSRRDMGRLDYLQNRLIPGRAIKNVSGIIAQESLRREVGLRPSESYLLDGDTPIHNSSSLGNPLLRAGVSSINIPVFQGDVSNHGAALTHIDHLSGDLYKTFRALTTAGPEKAKGILSDIGVNFQIENGGVKMPFTWKEFYRDSNETRGVLWRMFHARSMSSEYRSLEDFLIAFNKSDMLDPSLSILPNTYLARYMSLLSTEQLSVLTRSRSQAVIQHIAVNPESNKDPLMELVIWGHVAAFNTLNERGLLTEGDLTDLAKRATHEVKQQVASHSLAPFEAIISILSAFPKSDPGERAKGHEEISDVCLTFPMHVFIEGEEISPARYTYEDLEKCAQIINAHSADKKNLILSKLAGTNPDLAAGVRPLVKLGES